MPWRRDNSCPERGQVRHGRSRGLWKGGWRVWIGFRRPGCGDGHFEPRRLRPGLFELALDLQAAVVKRGRGGLDLERIAGGGLHDMLGGQAKIAHAHGLELVKNVLQIGRRGRQRGNAHQPHQADPAALCTRPGRAFQLLDELFSDQHLSRVTRGQQAVGALIYGETDALKKRLRPASPIRLRRPFAALGPGGYGMAIPNARIKAFSTS